MTTSPKDPHLFELFSAALKTGLEYLRLADKDLIGKHINWPEISWQENGLPYVTNDATDGPTNYSEAIVGGWYSTLKALGLGDDAPSRDFEKEPSFLALRDYVLTQPRLHSYFMCEKVPEFWSSRLLGTVGDMLDHYVHTADKVDLEDCGLLPSYLPIETCLLEETLPTTVVVPILFLKFTLHAFRINDVISVERLSDAMLMARGWHGPWIDSDNSLVQSAATHALFISRRFIDNHDWMTRGQAIVQAESYPIEIVNSFFAALRISTGYATAYAQLLTLPVGWASGYAAKLVHLDGTRVKSYPPAFERKSWHDDVPTITASDAEKIRETFESLQQILKATQGRRVRLAMHRLNLSAMREADEDGIIDAMIAMEALLSDGTQEMTHKVALRLAGLYKLIHPSRAVQVFREIRRLYAFRSKIVHGAADLDKSLEVDRDGVSLSAVEAAVEHLRTAFAVLLRNPILLDPTKIDTFLLTDRVRD